jgi:uncharacterized protein YfaS (alpha-2-macroglobulin family)
MVISGIPLTSPPPEQKGLFLSKSFVLSGGEVLDLGNPETFKKPIRLSQGEVVEVKITLEASRELGNVVIADLFPGGLELERTEPGEREGAHLEAREERVIIIPSGAGKWRQSYSYVLRAVTPGEFLLPPITAEAMYEPEYRAILPTGILIVEGSSENAPEGPKGNELSPRD